MIKVFHNISQLMTLRGAVKKQGRYPQAPDLGLINKAALVVEAGEILWVGREGALPQKWQKAKKIDLKGQNVFPGFVDAHTHMVFAGDRRDEFEMRNQGISYQEIAEQGGGILSTMKATRKASLAQLTKLAQERADKHLSQGVTTVEIKSGYGLESKSEEKMLKAAQAIKGVQVVTTFLGAHAIPQGQSESQYLDQLSEDLVRIKKLKLAERVDIFIEKGYFSIKKARQYLKRAQSLGFDITIHADQLSRSKASLLGIELGALSVDHAILLKSSDKTKLAQSETVALLLPSADFYLECSYPDARSLIDQGGCVALATDYNPGSSPSQSLALVGILARLKMKMTLPEVFVSLTYAGAKALKLAEHRGALCAGYQADFFTSDESWREFFYDFTSGSVNEVHVKGRRVYRRRR